MKHEEHSDQGNIFVAFIGAGCNKWLWDDKITRFNVFVRGGCGVDENIWKFAGGGGLPKSNKYEQVERRGPIFGHLVIM